MLVATLSRSAAGPEGPASSVLRIQRRRSLIGAPGRIVVGRNVGLLIETRAPGGRAGAAGCRATVGAERAWPARTVIERVVVEAGAGVVVKAGAARRRWRRLWSGGRTGARRAARAGRAA